MLDWIMRTYWRLRCRQFPGRFDAVWYRQYYPDIVAADVDPLIHYIKYGQSEGRLPYCPPLFDAQWYKRQYPDVAELDDPLGHYWYSGASEGRDPGPDFSTSGYLLRYPEAAEAINPLEHYMAVCCERGLEPLPELEGNQMFQAGKPVLVVCGHQAGRELYGAERSLLDVLTALSELDVNLVVTMPSAVNSRYIAEIQSVACKVAIIPYGWWRAGQPSVAATVSNFSRLLKRYNASALYANTLVLNEPLLAAHAMDIPVIVHVRELPAHDEELCQSLGATADSIIERLTSLADVVIANSSFTAQSLGLKSAIVVPNTIEPSAYSWLEEFSTAGKVSRSHPPTVAMISSNLPKKGLADFVALAQALQPLMAEARCLLIGPDNVHTQMLRKQQASGELPSNLFFAEYCDTPQQALAQADVIVNLSHFQESFGRTVLEAMASGKPVVAYRWGALPDLVVDKETGFLVPLGDVTSVTGRVEQLLRDSGLRHRMGLAGRERVIQNFSPPVARSGLCAVLQIINQNQ
jgi:glycosyltransferase involved in cell wall biosynthesis